MKIYQSSSNYKLSLFIGLVLFLITWSFLGKELELKIYDQFKIQYFGDGNIGAQFIASDPNNSISLVMVGDVLPNSQSDKAGLRIGDQIIGVDGQIVTNVDMILFNISQKKTGSNLRITVFREGRYKDIYVRMNDHINLDRTSRSKSLPVAKKTTIIVIFATISMITFGLIYNNYFKRLQIILSSAIILLILGIFLGIYTPVDAFFALKWDTLSLLIGMRIISGILDECGFFDSVAYRIYKFSGNKPLNILILFCLLSYGISLFVNNLATMLIVVPITLSIAACNGFNPVPVIIGEIISSNLGSASTMIGDFPFMLISSEAGIGMIQFIVVMMPICLVLLALLLFFIRGKVKGLGLTGNRITCKQNIKIVEPLMHGQEKKAAKITIVLLFHLIILLVLSEKLSLNPSALVLSFGLTAFLFSGLNKNELLARIGFLEVLFFVGTFTIIGLLEASGIYQYINSGINALSWGKPWFLSLIILWSATFFTSFLSAGPTASFFLPIVFGMDSMSGNNVLWWSLSLGILCGSCSTIMGSIAGPATVSVVDNFCARNQFQIDEKNNFTFNQFNKIGFPISLIFLMISSIYLLWLGGKG